MNGQLFDDEKLEVVLWDDMRKRIILRCEMTEEQIKRSNEWFLPTCGHLQYKKAEEVKTRTYTIKR